MKVSWKNKKQSSKNLKPSYYIKHLNMLEKTPCGGQIKFKSMYTWDVIVALENLLNFEGDADLLDKANLIQSVIFDKEVDLTALTVDSFIASLNKELSKIKRGGTKRFTLLTPISADDLNTFNPITINGATIRFVKHEDLDIGSKLSRLKYLKSPFYSGNQDKSNSTFACVDVCENRHLAMAKAIEALDLFRAAFNLTNTMLSLFIAVDPDSYKNKLMFSGIHTLHNEEGTLVSQKTPNHIRHSVVHVSQEQSEKTMRFLEQINSLEVWAEKDRKKIRRALINYCNAMDESDSNVCIIRLWAILEKLNDGRSENVVRRVSFLQQDSEHHRIMLEHCKEYRNENVHELTETVKESSYRYAIQIQRYFYDLIHYYLENGSRHTSLSNANRILDIDPNTEKIQKQIETLEEALSLRKSL